MSTIEVLANSKADHGLVPLEPGRVYAPVLCTTPTTADMSTGDTAMIEAILAAMGGTTALLNEVGNVRSAGIPVRGSARELLSVRTGSIG